MSNVKQFYGDSFIINNMVLYSGSTAVPHQFGDRPAKLVRFKAWSTNLGSIFIGESITHLFFELAPGDDTGWCSLNNLNQLWYRPISGTMDYLTIWVQD